MVKRRFYSQRMVIVRFDCVTKQAKKVRPYVIVTKNLTARRKN